MMADIPFKYVSRDTWYQLANKLDPDTMKGNNWTMLAEKLGYTTEDIMNIECRQASHGRNTLKLFEDYVKKAGNSVTKLHQSLETMERPDALDVLLNAIPEIERRYTVGRNNSRVKLEPGENSCNFSSTCCSGNCAANSNMAPHHHHMTMCSSQYSHCSSQFCSEVPSRSQLSSRSMHHGTKELNTIPSNYPSYSSNSSHVVPSRTISQYMTSMSGSDSMDVNFDTSDHYIHENIPMDTDMDTTVWSREQKAALPRTIFKGKNCMPSLSRIPPLLNYNDMTIGNEEVVETSESMGPPNIYGRQVSEEINSNQPLVEPSVPRMPAPTSTKLGLKLPVRAKVGEQNGTNKKKDFFSPSPTTPGNPLAKLQQFTNSESYMPDKEYTSIMAAKNREELLYNRSNLDDMQCRVPVQRELHTDEDFRMIFNFGAGTRNQRTVLEQQMHSRQMLSQEKVAVNKEPPRTFPLRAKSMLQCISGANGASVGATGDNAQECLSGLTKSQSMPDDMKPAECQKKKFSHIKVLVTYSNDSKRHIQKVLNLCRCLEKNGFTCCMDIYNHKMDSSSKTDWCNKRFAEADFVLVCVTSNYMTEAMCMADNNNSSLNTAYIYQLMESEIQNDVADIERRFIPVLFDGSLVEDVPEILQHRLKYVWPKQYSDLLWYLTKPETRTKSKASNYVEQCPKSPRLPNIPT